MYFYILRNIFLNQGRRWHIRHLYAKGILPLFLILFINLSNIKIFFEISLEREREGRDTIYFCSKVLIM